MWTPSGTGPALHGADLAHKVHLHEPQGRSKKEQGKIAAGEVLEDEAPNDQGDVSGRARMAGALETQKKQKKPKRTVTRTRDSAKHAQA
jgi:hypothetical protein